MPPTIGIPIRRLKCWILKFGGRTGDLTSHEGHLGQKLSQLAAIRLRGRRPIVVIPIRKYAKELTTMMFLLGHDLG